MNYIKEINSFYDWLELNSVSDSVITLWHALMHINNKAAWNMEFTVAISTLQVKTSLSKSSIIRARNVLKQLGRIDFRERKGNQSCAYKVIAFHGDTQNETQPETEFVTQSVTQTVTQTDTINKLNYTKLNNVLLEKEPKEKNLEKEFLEDDFLEPINLESKEKEKSSVKKEKEKYFNRADFKKKLLQLGVLEKHADDWIEARKKKRASFTESVIDAVIRECEKHNYPFPEAIRHCAEGSWQGFKYSWVLNLNNNGKSNNFNTNNGTGYKAGTNNGAGFKASGKVSARTLLARRISQNSTTDSESGNITIDVEAIE